MANDAYGQILRGLKEWVDLFEHPRVSRFGIDFRRRLARIEQDPSLIRRLLLDRRIWGGGMGSFFDSAHPDIRPTGRTPAQRADQWQAVHKEEFEWEARFYRATILLGTALVSWCSDNGRIEPSDKNMVERQVEIYRHFAKMRFRPLTKGDIRTLEHNLFPGRRGKRTKK